MIPQTLKGEHLRLDFFANKLMALFYTIKTTKQFSFLFTNTKTSEQNYYIVRKSYISPIHGFLPNF